MEFTLRLRLFIVTMMLIVVSAKAGIITEEQAKAKAQSFLQTRSKKSGDKRLAPVHTPSELHISSSGEKAIYVFNVGEQDGFIIVSGDDRTRPILGYADNGVFETGSIPTALNEMLSIYARQIEMLQQNEANSDPVEQTINSRRRISGLLTDVAPLLSTKWNQGGPYNDFCPTLDGQTALTGCVATAMAQIANYHEYPTDMVPSLAAYTSSTNKINVSAWGATSFDWDNMLDTYSGSENSVQKAAVATLMRYCGQAAQMDYGFSSGAFNGDALYAFQEKLGYSESANFKSASSYSANGWEDLIYKELSQGRPVYYSALDGDEGCDVGGHAFVIDGYAADGNYFHVNWGWGGICDGYFNLFALDPNAPESAATSTGWHYQMLALIGLSPEAVNTAKLTKDASGSYLITSTDDWNELSANTEMYNDCSFKLTNDISVTTMLGTSDIPFCGNFDGQGHTLHVSIESDVEYTAPFRYVANSTFKNLTVAGTLSVTNHFAGGIIGRADDVVLQGCESKVTIQSYFHGDGTHGGFISVVRSGMVRFYDCVFSGMIKGENTDCCAGFCGWRDSDVEIFNCLNIGDFELASNNSCATFSRNGITQTNSYYKSSITNAMSDNQGTSVSEEMLLNGSVAYALQSGTREWSTEQIWGQQIGVDSIPMLTSDTSKVIYIASFVLDGQVIKKITTNSPIGDKMPTGEDFGLTNVAFKSNGTTFTGTTIFNSDITIEVTGKPSYSLSLETPIGGSLSINSNSCIPGKLMKITAIPEDNYLISAIMVTDNNGRLLPITPVSNSSNEYVFVFPKSSVTVNAEFTVGKTDPVRFINRGLTLPSSWRNEEQSWTADTWMIWGDAYSGIDDVIVGAPPIDALGHEWYEEGYMLTNNDDDVLPNGNKIVWENHSASFRNGGNYDYFRATGADGDRTGDFYIRRIFTFNNQTVPSKLYLSCSYDDSPVEYYINGVLVYMDHRSRSYHDGCYEVELTDDQIELIHTDGTPNVLAAHASQNWGGYHLDCGLYDPTAINYEVTSENSVSVQRNVFLEGNITIPSSVDSNGVTYLVTELSDNAFNGCHNLLSVCLPSTLTNVGNNAFDGCDNLEYVKSYVPIYRDQTLIAAPVDAQNFELPMGYSNVHRNAFKFTDSLITLTLPRSITYIGENAFVGNNSLTDIYAYSISAPQIESNSFDGVDKSAVTVHVYASALDSYKKSWGEDFKYVTIPDPQPITLSINVTITGSIDTLIKEAVAEKNGTIYDIVNITITGTINNDDLLMLASMCTGMSSMSTIDISDAVIQGNTIDHNVFNGKEKLTSIKLPETLEYIGENAFNNCKGLTSIDIPASVKRIRSYAFDNCPNLIEVTGCEGLTDVNAYDDWYIFGWTPNIQGDVYGGTTFLSLDKDATGEYEVPKGIKVIAGGAMHGRNISSVVLPASVTDLGNDVFRGCHSLLDFYVYAVNPPICHNGSMEYDYDKSKATLYVPATAVENYKNADEWREMGRIVGIVVGGLVDMTIHVNTAGTLDDSLFDAAVAESQISDKLLIRNLTVTGNLNANDIAYLNMLPNTLYNMEMLDISGASLEDNIITERMFQATLYNNIKLPSTVISIGNEAFKGSRRLSDINLPDSLEYIGSYAFAETGLSSIVIPDGVTEMGDRGVQNCHSLNSIKFGSCLANIPECWAEGCNNLKEVTIGKRVTSISWRAFCGTNIEHVYSYAKAAPSWNDSFYDGINTNAVLHLYSNNIKRYENTEGWENFSTIVGDLGLYPSYDVTVNVDIMGTFSDALHTAMVATKCEDVMDISRLTITGSINDEDLIYLRDNVDACLDVLDLSEVTVQNNTFYESTLRGGGFEELILPTTLKYLDGWYILRECPYLKSIHIPNSLKNIRPYFLYRCSSLETVTGGDGVIEMENDNGMYFDDCHNLKSPVILNKFFFRLPFATEGAYEMPEYVTAIARDGLWHVENLTALTLHENITTINGNAFSGDINLKDIYFYAVELPNTHGEAFNDIDRSNCTLHVYEEMAEVFKADELWKQFNVVGDLGAMPNLTPMNESDYADLCAIYNTLDGDNWTTKWIVNKNVQTASRWKGVTFDEEGYIISINLSNNALKGDISSLAFSGLAKLSNLNLSSNKITGDILSLAGSLPNGCTLDVMRQDLGYIGEHSLYEVCNYGELPNIAYYHKESGTLANTLIGVGGVCQFYHAGTDGGQYWDCYIESDGSTQNNFKFYWPSPAIVECHYPHHFTFTYNYKMGDVNMDDYLNVLDLQSTLNYSNNQHSGLFNFYAADTYGPDDDINVQDIVSTVNILLAQDLDEQAETKASRLSNPVASEACIMVENGEIVLYTTRPVAALELRLDDISPEGLKWNTEELGFVTSVTAYSTGTHAIIYSMQQCQIEIGRTVLAIIDEKYRPYLSSAVLSDSQARSISLGNTLPTGIVQQSVGIADYWSLTSMSGLCLASGTHAAEADILKLAKARKLQGIFILEMDGVKRKIMIK